TTGSGPYRSDKVPQIMLVVAIARNPIVIALETPVTDHPVSFAIGCNRTGSENMPPMATQPKSPPAATMTQRYLEFSISFSVKSARSRWKTNGTQANRHRLATFFTRWQRDDHTGRATWPSIS